jgi:hypothetical protein
MEQAILEISLFRSNERDLLLYDSTRKLRYQSPNSTSFSRQTYPRGLQKKSYGNSLHKNCYPSLLSSHGAHLLTSASARRPSHFFQSLPPKKKPPPPHLFAPKNTFTENNGFDSPKNLLPHHPHALCHWHAQETQRCPRVSGLAKTDEHSLPSRHPGCGRSDIQGEGAVGCQGGAGNGGADQGRDEGDAEAGARILGGEEGERCERRIGKSVQ